MRGCKRRSNQIARHKRRATSLKDVRYAQCVASGDYKMKILTLLTIAWAWLFTSCVTNGLDGLSEPTYWDKRKMDARDIFTLTISKPALGAKAQIGPVGLGLYDQQFFSKFFRHQEFGLKHGEINSFVSEDLTCIGTLGEQSRHTYLKFGRDGEVRDSGVSFNRDLERQRIALRTKLRMKYSRSGLFVSPPERTSIAQYSRLELAAGLYTGVRVGFNPLELFDFFIGFTTYDLASDDYFGPRAQYLYGIRSAASANPSQ